MSWTIPATAIAGDVLTAAWLNTYLRDNTNLLKTSVFSDGRISGEIRNFREDVATLSIVAGTIAPDLGTANVFKVTLSANVTDISLTGWTTLKSATAVIKFTQDGSGGKTVAFPGGWKWSNGVAATMPSAASKTLIVLVTSFDGGSTIYASIVVTNA